MAFTPSYNKSYVLTGVAALYLQPYDYDEPAEPPEDTQVLGTKWPVPWTPAGATLEGVTMNVSREASDIRIEEQVTQVDQATTSVTFTVSTELSEDTLETMRYAYGGGSIETVAPTATKPGKKRLRISSEIEHFGIGLESTAAPRVGLEVAPWRRIVIPDVTSVAEVETSYRRAEQQRTYPATFTSLVPPEDVIIDEYDADPTG